MKTDTQQQTKHTPGPWRVMPCPQHAGKHAFHDSRWIATADAEVEYGHDPRSWGLTAGALICEMRDGPAANARLIAASPDLLEALRGLLSRSSQLDQSASHDGLQNCQAIKNARIAIEKAEGRA